MSDQPELVVVDVAVGSLRPHERNPRTISKQRLAALKADLEADPEMLRARPLIALPDGRVIAGNQRLRAVQELGWELVPVVYADLDEGRAREWALRDNNPYGEWDEQTLAVYLHEMVDAGAELARAGFTDKQLEQYLRSSGSELADPEPPPVPDEPESKPGEVYELGPHRLLCGDATDPGQIAGLMEGQAADLLWTDPPYGVSYADKNEFLNRLDRGNRVQTPIVHDHADPEEMAVFWRLAFTAVRPVVRAGASYYVTGPQGGELLLLLMTALRQSGFPLRHMLVWAKNNHVLGRADYQYKHEPILYGWVDGAAHAFYGEPGETSVWEISRPHRSDLHPTMKPVELVARAVANSSQPGEIVLDPFAGSGSTLIAADQLERRCYLIEIDPRYCDVIRQRYDDYRGSAGG